MAHRLAELMERAASATGHGKAEADAQVEALILELWWMRAALPGHVDPDKRLERAIRALEQLDQESSIYQPPLRGSIPALNAAARARQDMATLNAQLVVLLVAEEFDTLAAQEEGVPLSEQATEFREKLDTKLLEFVEGRIFFRSAAEKDSEPRDNKALVRIRIAEKLGALRAALDVVGDALEPEPPALKRPRKPPKADPPVHKPSHRKI